MNDLGQFVKDFASAVAKADQRRPQAIGARSKLTFQPGIGPHSEARTIALVGAELELLEPDVYRERLFYDVQYPGSKQRCDVCLGTIEELEWAIEAKMLRMLGDNGKANDNILMHLLSPYPAHRSALTDCEKLTKSNMGKHKAILIYGYEAADWPLHPAIEAFEILAKNRVRLGDCHSARFEGLVHPVHSSGEVFAWELMESA